jgi:hypothetical protein
MDEFGKTVSVLTDVVWTCKNTVQKDAAPVPLDMTFYLEERTPPVELDGVVNDGRNLGSWRRPKPEQFDHSVVASFRRFLSR